MQLDDLSTLDDEDLCALESNRSLDPADFRRIDDELRRRRQSRLPGLADMPSGPPAHTAATLGDLERVFDSLKSQLVATETTVRRLRWWVALSPVIWALVAGASVLVLRTWGIQ